MQMHLFRISYGLRMVDSHQIVILNEWNLYVVIASLAFYVQLKYFREFSYYFMHEAETFRVQTNSDLHFIP